MVRNLSQPSPQAKHGTISEDEIWSGVIEVDGDVIISSEASLKILPGTTVIFCRYRHEGFSCYCHGIQNTAM